MHTRTSRASGHALGPWWVKRLPSTILAALGCAGSVAWALEPGPIVERPFHQATQHGVAAPPPLPRRAHFGDETPSLEVQQLADWVVHSNDSPAMPFVLIDKKNAKVYVFQVDGRLHATAPALLGLAVGDDAVPGIGQRKLSSIRPQERTTPAGRFVASLAHNLQGRPILWVDYEGAVSLHPVVAGTPQEQRARRLSSPSPQDNRISYGCINVPVDFFHSVIKPAFTGTNGVVYVMPETRPVQQVFASYDIDAPALALSAPPVLSVQTASAMNADEK